LVKRSLVSKRKDELMSIINKGVKIINEINSAEVLDDVVLYGMTISALKVVYMNAGKAYIASSGELSQANRVIGVAVDACTVGHSGRIRKQGYMKDNSWHWQLDKPIFLGINGALTQTAPVSGFVCQIAVPISSNEIDISIRISILRS